MSAENVLNQMKEADVAFVDLRFADTRGKEQHVTVPASQIEADFFEDGKMFDGSSIAGWKGINESDMVLMPDSSTAVLDPFSEEVTMNLRCDVLEPSTMQGYERCPRSIAKRAEAFLSSTGIADSAMFGPEPEFFVFDDVRWAANMQGAFYRVDSQEAEWNSERAFEDGNMGHRPGVKGGYFPVPPVDSLHDMRGDMCMAMEEMGLTVEVHHHEVATAGQCEIGTAANTLVRKADELLILKYCVHNVAHSLGKTATFMPKPLVGDNGSGMHVHQSLSKEGTNIFAGDKYAGLSQEALWYVGGIFKHARALNAFTNAGTNSHSAWYPVLKRQRCWRTRRNRSASAYPASRAPKADALRCVSGFSGNAYFTFAALMMAGLDGIRNQIDPGAPQDKDLYDLPPEEEKEIPTVCSSLEQALEAPDADREFLNAGDVFTNDAIDAYIELKMEEVTRFRMTTHPVEFDMYYSN